MRKPHGNIIGNRYGRLVVLNRIAGSGKTIKYLCRCDCMIEKTVSVGNLIHGSTKSCGCLAAELISKRTKTHGKSNSVEFRIWESMKSRCYYNKNSSYHNYGGRGITVCDEWKDNFELFLKDMGERPSPKHSLERIDFNKCYCKENCKWILLKYQNWNKRNTCFITFLGDTKPLPYWRNLFGLKISLIHQRLKIHKWRIDARLFTVFPIGYIYHHRDITIEEVAICKKFFTHRKMEIDKRSAMIGQMIYNIKNDEIVLPMKRVPN